jgi:uncharacterized damage-inducible protein DinB
MDTDSPTTNTGLRNQYPGLKKRTQGSGSEVQAVDKQSLTRLFNYHYWANRQLWRSVMALSDQQFVHIPGDGSPSIRTQLVRMVAAENLWVNYLWHGEVEFLEESHFATRACLRAEWDALEEEILDFIEELSPAELEAPVELAFLNSGASLKVWEILLQIINQAGESRARLSLQLRRLGSPASAQEFTDYLIQQPSIPA